ncbi:hypothetical protein QR680_007521 [Steinernema hermaphroditum]|uniref:CCHC-type domain-containing protein n=1 Tax=Steinernema hermaphroditum TaxID=289476 RepID=A0AA39IEV0_9BILA|nr:hypothetical protein QR680_007521 [Steinernema hermaphroditum]
MAGNKNTVFDGKLKSRCEKLEDICSRDIRHVARSVSDVERILTERIQALEAKLKETAKHLTTECTFLAEAVDQTNNRLTKIESAGDDPQNTPAVAVVTQRPHTPASEIDSEAESEEEFRNTVSIFDEIMEAQRSPRQEIVEIHAITDDPPRETFETLPEESKKSFEKACEALKAFFESPKIRNAARQSLSNCRKSSSESVAAFANRLRPLVLAAMIGQNEEAFQNRLLDEFLDRLSPRQLAREVKLSDPETFEQALFKAQQVENLEVSERGSEIHLVKPLDHSHQAINELTERVNQIETNFAQAKRGGGRFRRGGDSRSNNRRWNNQGQRNNYSDRFRNNSNGQYGNSNNNRRYNPGNYERTNDGRPICNHCGKIGHFEQTCFRRLPPSDNPSQWNHRHQRLAELANPDLAGHPFECNALTIPIIEPCVKEPQVAKRQPTWLPPRVSALSWNLLLFISLCLFPITLAIQQPLQPMLCHTSTGRQVWELPHPHVFPMTQERSHNIDTDAQPLDILLFYPNKINQDTDAWYCRKIKTTTQFYTNILGDPIEKRSSEHLPVPFRECERMIKLKECSEGPLKVALVPLSDYQRQIYVFFSPKGRNNGRLRWISSVHRPHHLHLFRGYLMTCVTKPKK